MFNTILNKIKHYLLFANKRTRETTPSPNKQQIYTQNKFFFYRSAQITSARGGFRLVMEPLKSIWGDIANLRHERRYLSTFYVPNTHQRNEPGSPEKRARPKGIFHRPVKVHPCRATHEAMRIRRGLATSHNSYIYEFDSNNLDDKKAGLFYLHPKSIINGLYVQSMVSRPQRTANKMRCNRYGLHPLYL